MPLPVIADTFRCTLNWASTGGVLPHNVFHVQALTGNEADLFAVLEANFTTNMFAFMHDGINIESVDIIKLDGSSAQQSFNMTEFIDGQGTGDVLPAYAAVLSLHTTQRGPRGRGRMFIGPTTEALVDNGTIGGGGFVDATITAWDTFKDDLAGAGVDLGVASYAHSDFHGVTTFSMSGVAGIQRRRQEQLR